MGTQVLHARVVVPELPCVSSCTPCHGLVSSSTFRPIRISKRGGNDKRFNEGMIIQACTIRNVHTLFARSPIHSLAMLTDAPVRVVATGLRPVVLCSPKGGSDE